MPFHLKVSFFSTHFPAMRPVALIALVIAGCTPRPGPAPVTTATMLIANARIIDGSGGAARSGSVRLAGDRISEVGTLRPRPGEPVIDAEGLVLAPGFIDTHSHHDRGLFEMRGAAAAVSQGITTIVVGQDGGSRSPLADFFARLEREPPAVNVASYSGHGSVREQVMGADFKRAATPQEIERMRELVRADMQAGALGLSTGLEYDPGIYSTPEEVVELARVASSFGGRYISHIRSEDRQFWQAIDEIIAIGRQARIPVQVSHIKLAMRSLWGRADSLVRVLDRARASGVDITADIYPYTYWQSTLTVLFPERDFENRATAEFVLREISAPEGLLLARFDPDTAYVGRTVAQIAAARGTDPPATLMALIRESLELERRTGSSAESVIGTSMTERDIERLLAWPFANVCSDGGLAGRHPRGFGAFTRVLGEYTRDRRVFSLEEAVRKMTSLSARNVGIVERGRIAPGHYADLVLFDAATVRDVATPEQPQARSVGIRRVWVNGELVYDGNAPTARHPGQVLRRVSR
jgi:N-acyl-D-amino-acid deacylase